MEKETKHALQLVIDERDHIRQRLAAAVEKLNDANQQSIENDRIARLFEAKEAKLQDTINKRETEIQTQSEKLRELEVVLELERQSQLSFDKLFSGMRYLLDHNRLHDNEIQSLKELYPDELFDEMYKERRQYDTQSPEWLREMDKLKDTLTQKESEINQLLVQLG